MVTAGTHTLTVQLTDKFGNGIVALPIPRGVKSPSEAPRDAQFGVVDVDWRPVVRLHRHRLDGNAELTSVYEMALQCDPCDDEASVHVLLTVSQRRPAWLKPALYNTFNGAFAREGFESVENIF